MLFNDNHMDMGPFVSTPALPYSEKQENEGERSPGFITDIKDMSVILVCTTQE